ncbi:MBL fold metallo-hydrolase [Streptomyces sp. NPDC098781]|uniref:MBL fold metallo-hydrolase n=1 Tax=Streptomyces sp. NPDC098781 TaxID=3366097 RepID=UPI003800D9C2
MSDGILGYDVFVSDPFSQNIPGSLPNGEPRLFSPLSTTLIYGREDAVLVEAPLLTDQAEQVGDWIEGHGKRLTHIFITHGHGDHWFTADLLAKRFGAQVVASAGTIKQMHASVAGRAPVWDKAWPGQIPPTQVTADTVPDNRFALEGHDLFIVEVGHSDGDDTTVLHVPDLDLVVAGDVLYNGVHQYLGQSMGGGRDAWRRAIETVEALDPRWIVAGHKDKARDDDATRLFAETRAYLDAADELLVEHDTALGFFDAMLERFPDRGLGTLTLWSSAQALINARKDPENAIRHMLDGWVKVHQP